MMNDLRLSRKQPWIMVRYGEYCGKGLSSPNTIECRLGRMSRKNIHVANIFMDRRFLTFINKKRISSNGQLAFASERKRATQ